MKIRVIIFSLVFVLISCVALISLFAQGEGETLTITTYYPSPYGVYNELRIYPNDNTHTCSSANEEGTMYYDLSEHKMKICDYQSGSYAWRDFGGGGGPQIYTVKDDSTPPDYLQLAETAGSSTDFLAITQNFPDGNISVSVTASINYHTDCFKWAIFLDGERVAWRCIVSAGAMTVPLELAWAGNVTAGQHTVSFRMWNCGTAVGTMAYTADPLGFLGDPPNHSYSPPQMTVTVGG